MGRINKSNVDATEYQPEDFGAEVLEGDLDGKLHLIRDVATGGAPMLVGLVRAEPSTAKYKFPGDSTVLILEGEVTVTLDDGESVDLSSGDIATFPKGATSTWTIKTPFKELVVECP